MGKPIAKCYLLEEGDDSNVCFLTDETLTIIFQSKKSTFFNHWVKAVKFRKKMFLLPIVFGGIVAPLAGLGLVQYYLNPWLMLSLLFGSCLAIYYGIMGGTAFIVETRIKEYDFFVKKETNNMLAFTSFVNNNIHNKPIQFYLILPNNLMGSNKTSEEIQTPKEGISLYQTKPNKLDDNTIFKVVSENLPFEIKYVETDTGLQPKIYDPIPFSSLEPVS